MPSVTPGNKGRSEFIEQTIADISVVEGYEKYGINRENVGVIVTYVMHRFFQTREAEGVQAVEAIFARGTKPMGGGV